MSVTIEIQRLQSARADLKAAINAQMGGGVLTSETIDDYATAVQGLRSPATLETFATTVKVSASSTANIATNDRIRIFGSDHKSYTLAQWNALWEAAGFDKDNMEVSPIGLRVTCNDVDEIYMFDRYTGVVYNVTGEVAYSAGMLRHSIYTYTPISATDGGTDITTGKAWTVTENAQGKLVLYEANTKQSWVIEKECGTAYAHKAFNPAPRTEAIYAQNEWMRHRFAITSGVVTTAEDGTYGEIKILNASGAQAAVGEDMYFWVKNDNGVFVNTNLLAKYNVSNRHNSTTSEMTASIATTIYDKQKAAGINMNDSGVNSASVPILAPGGKGAEIIAVDGFWFIITPYISSSSSSTSSSSNNIPDSPAVYWAISKGLALPSDSLLSGIANNLTLCERIVSYLNNYEGWGLPTIPTGNGAWSAIRSGYTSGLVVTGYSGTLQSTNTYFHYFITGSLTPPSNS